MRELKAFKVVSAYIEYEDGTHDSGFDFEAYDKDEADKVIADLEESHKKEVEQLLIEIAELKNRIAPKQSDKTLQDRLNEVCEKHGVSTLQDLDWAFCMTEARLEDYAKILIDKHKALEKMLQYKVLYKEKCRDVNTQERFFALKIAHHKYKRCLAMAKWCEATALWCYQAANTLPAGFHATLNGKRVMIEPERLYKRFYILTKWNGIWLKIAEKFKGVGK